MIRKRMERLSGDLNKLLEAQNKAAAKGAAKDASAMTGLEVRYSAQRAKAICELVTPAQGENLAAVFTDKMGAKMISTLREATVSAIREQAVAGGSLKSMAHDMTERWSIALKDENPVFIDSAGREWNTAQYFQMNARTNAMRVYNDCLVDDVARETGTDLMRISRGGDPDCSGRFPWEGCIISISGKTKGFPTYEDARNGGCFHPNCTHTLEYVDEVADKDEIDLQKSHPVTGDAADADAQDERRYEIDQARKMRDEGLTAEQARVAVDRDNLEASIRNGLIRADAKDIVAKMTDAQVTRLCPNGNPPAFEPVKRVRGGTRKEPKYEPERWNHGKRGGVVHVKADADMAHILSVCKVDAQQTPAPAPTHAPTTRKTNANAPVAASKDKDEWKPTTALERATDALMSSIGVKHTDERLAIDGVNPNFDMTRQELSNKGLRTDAWTSNCQRCVPAYEMRLRGYDVTSNPFDGNRDGVRFFKDAFADAQVCRGGRRFKVDADAIVSSSPDGSRFLVRIKWEHGGAHFFMARKIGGNVIYEDPQDPTRNAANHFNSAGTGRGENWILRIDNREITQDIADAISIV